MENGDLEKQKLMLEIDAIKHPIKYNPSLWLSSVTALIAVSAFFAQLIFSKNEYTLAQIKQQNLEFEMNVLKASIASKSSELASIQERLTAAKELLNEAKPSVPDELRKRIMTFEEQRATYDPTGEHPYHLPPAE